MSWAVLNLFFKLFGTSMKLTLVRSAFSQQFLNILNVHIHMYIYYSKNRSVGEVNDFGVQVRSSRRTLARD